ncbi:hypothetical protein SAMN05443572_105497 [Myxococcus fulvus]|uniref:Lipoprotein n=1 Tax=Myxococcus fulvus TaxID=33 RepID=A0A511T6L0_MYXFU|nr:hypothetical protein [Myxococcus fulvus]GEN09243.1 hypothetical protein MFU01_42800 [Myxococcus fulvus]SEU16736.1 hypothetical protein SAMN05443572_105497 [Myxococcus fulvus]
MSAFPARLVSLSSLLAALVLYAGPASAETVTLNCPGTMAVNYSPGMTNTPRFMTISGTGVFGPCVGLPLGIISADYSGVAQGTTSCLTSSTTANLTLKWNDGTVSTLSLTQTLNTRPTGQVVSVYAGTVTAGRFQGAIATATLTLAQTDLLGCFTEEGVTATAGPAVFTIVSLL